MPAVKVIQSALLCLAVFLGLLALTPGVAPATMIVGVGGRGDFPWGTGTVFTDTSNSITDSKIVVTSNLAATASGAARAGEGTVGVSALVNYTSTNTNAIDAQAFAISNFSIHFIDPNRPEQYESTAPARFFFSGSLGIEGSGFSASQAFVQFSLDTSIYSLTIQDVGSGASILENNFGGNASSLTPGAFGGVLVASVPVVWNAENFFAIHAEAEVFMRGGGGLALGDGSANFFDTFSFATEGPVFLDLPVGATVNGGGIVDNHYTNPFAPQVPLPGTLVLLGSGLLTLVGFRRIKK